MRYPVLSIAATLWTPALILSSISTPAAPRPNAPAVVASSFAPQDQAPATPPAGSADASKQAQGAAGAAARVFSAVSLANSLMATGDKYRKQIGDIAARSPAGPQSLLDNMQATQSIVSAVQLADLINGLAKAKADLDPGSTSSSESARQTQCGGLSKYASLNQPDVTDAQAKCDAAQKQAADSFTSIPTSVGQLQSALANIYTYLDSQVAALNASLQPLATLQTGNTVPDAAVIERSLPAGLVGLKQISENQSDYKKGWSNVKSALTQLGAAAPPGASGAPAPNVDQRFTDLQNSINAILPNLGGWFSALAASLVSSAKTLDGQLADVATNPADNVAKANKEIADQSDPLAAADSIAGTWLLLARYLTDGQPIAFNLKATKSSFDDLQAAANAMRASISRMRDALAGDMSKFETNQVSLYYFTDVNRLMKTLNDKTITMGGVADAQAQAAEARNALIQTQMDLADAQAAVNRYQKQVLDLQEQQRQLQSKLNIQDSDLSKLGDRLKGAQDAKDRADAKVQDANAAKQQSPNDAAAAANARSATTNQTSAATKLSQSQSDYDSAKARRDATSAQVDDSQNQSNSLPAKLASAQQALSDAQTAVAQQSRKLTTSALAESDAFAFARDNAPFFFATADASSTDPVKRVFLYAYNDSKTIFMRGRPEDLILVRHVIADFDRPAPQARLTLWTFQLNSESDQKTNANAAKRLNRAMSIIDEELGDARALVNTTLETLRDELNEQVRSKFAALQNNLTQAGVAPVCTPQCAPADVEKLERVKEFYYPLVLDQLGFDVNVTTSDDLRLLRGLVPDPAGTTTLGESILILSLAKPEIRSAVRTNFEAKIRGRLLDLPLSPGSNDSAWRTLDPKRYLPLTWHALDIWDQSTPSIGLTSSQLEISRALRAAYDANRLHELADSLLQLPELLVDINQIEPQLDSLTRQIAAAEDAGRLKLSPAELGELNGPNTLANRKDVLKMAGISRVSATSEADYVRISKQRDQLDARRRRDLIRSVPIVSELRSHNISIDALTPIPSAGNQRTIDQLEAVRLALLDSPGLKSASPRQAAADEMLKEMIIAIEDDLSRLFVQPMIDKLRERLTSEAGVNVGVLQRESLLATNRGTARIDPRASAQLAAGNETDILSEVQQIVKLYATAQTGGALGVLGGLQGQPREPQPEIYALATGDNFQVTPVFDPSGQALRFKFDYVSTTNIQEPNGSTNPQLPRIDRMTVNTEVQLSNLETREISRFETNARIGVPTSYWGGFPIFKDLPVFRPWVPLLGWFVRRSGSNAVAQQSVIFGQTTIYPTIGALVDLLSGEGDFAEGGGTDAQKAQPEQKPEQKNDNPPEGGAK